MITALLLLATTPAQVQDCGQLPQQPMNMCLYEAFQRADAAMNAQWRITSTAMRARDQDLDRKTDKEPLHFETLLAAQRAWLTYRDKQCLVASFEMRGGSGAPMIQNLCLEALTRERTAQLRALVETSD